MGWAFGTFQKQVGGLEGVFPSPSRCLIPAHAWRAALLRSAGQELCGLRPPAPAWPPAADVLGRSVLLGLSPVGPRCAGSLLHGTCPAATFEALTPSAPHTWCCYAALQGSSVPSLNPESQAPATDGLF